MNLDDLQPLWNSPDNDAPAAEQRRIAADFARRMARRRRFTTLWLVNGFVSLGGITLLVGWNVAVGRTDLIREWALTPLLLGPWALAIHLLRRHLQPGRFGGGAPVVDALREALAANRGQRSGAKAVAILWGVLTPVLAVAIFQLRQVGKVSSAELPAMMGFFVAVAAISGLGLAIWYWRKLIPERRRLHGILEEMEAEAGRPA